MLAYISWHRPAAGVDVATYESALEGFHHSLARRPPSGFEGSCVFRAAELPWLAPVAQDPPGTRAGYEDWYLLDDWAALGVLEEAAVAHGHVSLHDKVASLSGVATSAVYRLIEGCSDVAKATVAVWVSRPPGHDHPSLAALLGDGMDPAAGGLWRRCVGLGPAPELCLLAREAPAGVGAERLPHGWTASAFERVALWQR